ncbi:MAG: hypothetical protein AB7S26_16440 [Sandaracinaceae bacterium]
MDLAARSVAALLLSASLGFGCAGAQHPDDPDSYVEVPLVGACEPGEPIQLLRYRQTAQRLEIDVTHSGGCNRHSYVACLEDPHPDLPQVYTLQIHHNAQGDRCRGEVYSVLRVELDRDLHVTGLDDGVLTLE